MTYKIAIQPDSVRHQNGVRQSFSDRWIDLAKKASVEVRIVDVFAPDLFDQLAGCDGFMWRFGFSLRERLLAKRLIPAVEHGLGIPVFPGWKTCWHFEDKIAQHYLLCAAGIPMPQTLVFLQSEAALDFCRTASYPLVIKLAAGYKSTNVRLVHNVEEATFWIRKMFGPGVISFAEVPISRTRTLFNRAHEASRVLARGRQHEKSQQGEQQHDYLYVQEFLPNNDFDTRVTVIGNRAFAFRRFNRPNDFRASGSGRIDWDAAQIDTEMVRLAFRVAQQLETQSVAIDGLYRGNDRVVNEISYTYASWAVRNCPGHWVLRGNSQAKLDWVEGHFAPEDAIFEDFMTRFRVAKRPSDRFHGSQVDDEQFAMPNA